MKMDSKEDYYEMQLHCYGGVYIVLLVLIEKTNTNLLKTKIDEYCASTIDFQKISNFWPVRNRMTRK